MLNFSKVIKKMSYYKQNMVVNNTSPVSQAHIILKKKWKERKNICHRVSMHLESGPALYEDKVESSKDIWDISYSEWMLFSSTCV